MNQEIEIPEGCEAKIVGNKVVFVPKESEDERIPRLLHELLCAEVTAGKFEKHGLTVDDALNWLERQKEYIEDIRQYAYNKGLVDAEEKQKPAEWSEEDDALLKEIVSFFKDGTVKLQHDLDLYAGFLENKFKSLRPQPKQGWSKKDEGLIDLAVAAVEDFYDKKNPIRVEVINFLHSLRPKPRWKPSKEQMDALRISYKIGTANESWAMRVLETLYSDLKNL